MNIANDNGTYRIVIRKNSGHVLEKVIKGGLLALDWALQQAAKTDVAGHSIVQIEPPSPPRACPMCGESLFWRNLCDGCGAFKPHGGPNAGEWHNSR